MIIRKFPIRIIFLCLLLPAALPIPGAAFPGQGRDEFLKHKKAGNYAAAIDAIEKTALSSQDPAGLELAVFMMQELMRYPELLDRGLEALNRIAGAAGARNSFLADRIDHARSLVYLGRGDITSAGSIQKSFSFLDFQAMGPFKNSGVEDFERAAAPELIPDLKRVCAGKYGTVSWFPASPDRTGTISFDELFPETRNSFFYLSRVISAPRSGEYYLICGKTGYTDLWLDGRRIFSDRTEHGFCHDQYFIRVHLAAGPHRLLLKAGDSDEGIRISLRVASADGARIHPGAGDNSGSAGQSALRGITFFPALAELMKIRNPGPEELFSTGCLLLAARLGNHDDNRGLRYLSGIPERHPLYSAACFYTALAHKDVEARDRYLNKSIRADPGNIESLRELAAIKISRNFVYEAYPLIEAIKKITPHAPWRHESSASLFMKLGWLPEAMRHAGALKESPYPSIGHRLESSIFRIEKDYFHAIPCLEKLIRADAFNLSRYQALLDCHEKTGNPDAAELVLTRMIALFPNNSSLKLRLAGIVQNRRGPGPALPYLTAALNAAPGNRDILKALGTACHKLGKKDLAIHYFDLACRHDPDNHALRQYLRIIRGEAGEIGRYARKDDVMELAAPAMKYRDEPAAILLDETVITVNTDGSFELWVRKIVMVNAQSEIRKFNNRYIVLDPDAESVENVSCAIVRGLVRTEIPERYRKSLSQPESRLYHNLEALVIPVPSLAPGDIIDLRYVIRNRGGGDYRYYFGEKITAGDSYRTLMFRAVLTHTADKPVYCHLKGIDAKSFSSGKEGRKTVYRISLDNIAPCKKERAMPDRSEILPAVYFTSHRSWDEFHGWYRSLLKNRIRIDAGMKEAVDTITAGKRDPLERIRAIYGFVTESIRYVGFEFGVGGIQPRGTDVTFHTKMGDCKDMSLLLVALLREAGIDARLALVRTRERGLPYLAAPFAGEFNHAICYVNHDGGFFLDPTAPDTGIRELPADDRATDAFVMDEKGWRFCTTAGGFYHRNRSEIASAVTITKTGTAEIKRALMKQGEAAPAARTGLKDRERHRRGLDEYWNGYYPGSSVRDLEVESSRIDEPVRYRYAVSIPGYARAVEGSIIFDAFLTRSELYYSYALSRTRAYPVILSGTGTTRTVTCFSIPGGYRVDRLPRNERYENEAFSAVFTFSASAGTVTVESVIDMKKTSVGTDDYSRFREFTRLVEKKERERIVLSPVSP